MAPMLLALMSNRKSVSFWFKSPISSVSLSFISSNIRAALEANAHVFVEKPLALTVSEAESLVDLAGEKGKKMVVGYILRVHPAWEKFVQLARSLGKPLVMRMNLNQQSSGANWYTHRQLMQSMSPIVDCGVHYVDIMCLMTQSIPFSG